MGVTGEADQASATRGPGRGPAALRPAFDFGEIARFCRRHYIRRLSLFGSVLRDDFGPASDVDVLVEFEPSHLPGLAFFEMEEELAAIIGRPVDLNTAESLSPYFRESVLREAVVLYDAARPAGAVPEHA